MNRLGRAVAVAASRGVARPSVASALRPAVFVAAVPAAVMTLPVRSFAGDAHHAPARDEPFLDPKMVAARVIEVVKNFEKVKGDKVTAQARFKEDLDLDSLDAVEVVMAIEEEFCIEIPDSEADKILSIADAVAYISNHPMAK